MLGTGEYTTGFTGSGASDSDKSTGVVALVMLDLRRRGKVGRLGMCGTDGRKLPAIRAHMKAALGDIIQTVLASFQDPHPRVRWAAINAMGQLETDLGPDLQNQLHAKVLPALVSVMDDTANARVQSHAAAAVINFCEHCERKTLRPYLQGLLTKLHGLLLRDVRRVQEQAVTAEIGRAHV